MEHQVASHPEYFVDKDGQAIKRLHGHHLVDRSNRQVTRSERIPIRWLQKVVPADRDLGKDVRDLS